MEEYYKTKRELHLKSRDPRLANADDPWGRRLAGEVEGVKTFGAGRHADYRISGARTVSGGTYFTLGTPEGFLELQTPLLGEYNVSNVAGAAALSLAAGVDGSAVARAARKMPQVPGRFERVARDGEFEVVVDYAHTDVGLAASLEVARGVVDSNGGGRIICVYGAAGDRDGAKRPLMGETASRFADLGIITTDDAYSESPEKIAREVAAGADPGRTEVVLDRRQAIERALKEARPGDFVVVAGKGHERVQHLPEGDVPFHDAGVIREILAGL